jgi:Tfp pilus assembly protein PilO
MKQLFLALFFLIISIGLFFAYIKPTYSQVQTLQTQNGSLSAALDKSRQLQEVRDSLRAKYNTFSQDDLAKLQTMLPDSIDQVRFIINLNAVAATDGVTIQSFAFSDSGSSSNTTQNPAPSTSAGPAPLSFSFNVETDYATFRKFMTDLEHSLQIIDITGLSLKADNTGKKDSFAVSMRTYWLPK